MLRDEEIGKERQGSFSLCSCFKYSFWMCAGPLASVLEKGTSNTKGYKTRQALCRLQSLLFIFLQHILPGGGTEKLLLWVTALAQSCLPSGSGWCWTPPGNPQCTGAGRLLGQHFSSPTGWAASSVPAQNCQSLAGGSHSSAVPPFPWPRVLWAWASLPFRGAKQHSYLSVLLRHLNFCACWSSFQSCESISAVPLLKTKHNQDRLWVF